MEENKKNKTNNVISFDTFTQELNASSSLGVYDITFPSLNKTYTFKQLTVGQQRTISKNSADIENKVAQIDNRLKLLKVLCQDESFDPWSITYPEFILAMAQIRDNNFGSEIKFNYTCQNEKCKMTIPITFNIASTITTLEEECTKAAEAKWEYEEQIGKNNLVFGIKYPNIKDYITITREFAAMAKQRMKETGETDMTKLNFEAENEDTAMAFMYSYIDYIKFNGKSVDMSSIKDMHPLDRMKFFEDNIKFNLIKFSSYIQEKMNELIEITKIRAVCPKCHKQHELIVDVDSFFQQ